jgi:hypothetical protein
MAIKTYWTRTFVAVATTVIPLGLAAPALAQAAPSPLVQVADIAIDSINTGNEGDVVLITTVAVPSESVGRTCEVVGETDNQESVHPGNDLLIVSGGQTLVVPDFEDAGYIIHRTIDIEAVGDTIEVYIRFGPDGVSSGGFRVYIDCTIPQPGEFIPVPSTVAPPVPPAAPTTVPTAPTTVPVVAPAPTSVPVTDTTAAPPAGPIAPAPAPPPAGPSLPVTGASTALIALIGAFLLATGIAVWDLGKSHDIAGFDR